METVRYCEIYELPQLQKFINDFWKKDHILSQNEILLKFQHHDNIYDRLNFIIAVDSEKGITSILGFIPTWQYDNNLRHAVTKIDSDIWLAIWCRAPYASKGIGMKLYEFLVKDQHPRSIAAIGINDEIKKRYQGLGFTTGELSHYYLFRDKKESPVPSSSVRPNIYISEIETFNQYLFEKETIPQHTPNKSTGYFKNRYKNHPYYEYKLYGIYNNISMLLDVMAVRKNKYEDKTCLRIVDVYNNFYDIKEPITEQLQYILQKENSEYIDCLNYGLPPSELTSLGFKKRIGDEIIIPNYFEPFENKNITIECAYKFFNDQADNYVIWKGDSDQDRPNIL